MNNMLPRYVMKQGSTYRYNPPAAAIAAGVAVRHVMGDNYTDVVAQAAKLNAAYDDWRSDKKYLANLTTKATVADLIRAYIATDSYAKLSAKSRKDYVYYLNFWKGSKLGSTPIMSTMLCNITAPMCQRLYNEHATHSVSLANHCVSVYKLVFNFAIRLGYITFNPFAKILRRQDKPRRVVWSKDDLKAFMDVSFATFNKRSVGLIVYMAYEWGQRLGDMRNLTWDMYNLDTGVLTLTQSKRRARVSLPTSNDLRSMLEAQHKDYGWQRYMAPSSQEDGKGGLLPYSLTNLSRVAQTIMSEANIPAELQLMDLRRTAITELVEAGVPLPNIMALSGHSTPQSLTPYMKATLKGSTLAQSMRGMI
jgi:integrase